MARGLAPLAALAAFPLGAGGAARYKSNSDLDAYVRSWAAGGNHGAAVMLGVTATAVGCLASGPSTSRVRFI